MRMVSRFAALLVLAFSLSGCGIIDWIYLPPSENTAQEMFEAGNDAMREKNYAAAIEHYTRLKDSFQFSPYALEAELSLADAYFLDHEWLAAMDSYKEFEGLHPRHEAIPYVLYNIGVASRNMYLSIDRPITPIEEAYSYFKRLADTYPDSEYAPQAKGMMLECRRLMAEHELYIADFYFRMKKYGSAWMRYKNIVDNFKDVPEIYAHAEAKIQAAFIAHKEQQAEETRINREGSWKKLFNWL